jgi:hypothetical protein
MPCPKSLRRLNQLASGRCIEDDHRRFKAALRADSTFDPGANRMSFKENMLRKISIERLAQTVSASLGPPGSSTRLDKDAMRKLLEMSPFRLREERDLDLYIRDSGARFPDILVLDNELPIYRTTVEDVVLRKSPYVKEMVNFRNVIKILKDSDVKISRKEDSVAAVRQACLEQLDLSHSAEDIENIAYDGAGSLESRYAEGVLENLAIFAELLELRPAPKPLRVPHHTVYAARAGEKTFGPVVIYGRVHNTLKMIDTPIDSGDPGQMEHYRRVVEGASPPAVEGPEVFKAMQKNFLGSERSGSPP